MIKPPVATITLLAFTALAPVAGRAADVQNTAEREIVRRQDNVIRAKKALEEGDKAMHNKSFDLAVVEYKAAADYVSKLPACNGKVNVL